MPVTAPPAATARLLASQGGPGGETAELGTASGAAAERNRWAQVISPHKTFTSRPQGLVLTKNCLNVGLSSQETEDKAADEKLGLLTALSEGI